MLNSFAVGSGLDNDGHILGRIGYNVSVDRLIAFASAIQWCGMKFEQSDIGGIKRLITREYVYF